MTTATATIRTATLDSPVGPLALAWRDDVVLALAMQAAADRTADTTAWEDEDLSERVRAAVAARVPEASFEPGPADAAPLVALARYFDGARDALDALAVDPGGTGFRAAVWRALRDIPAGAVRTYGELAAALGRPAGARAVGGAVGANPIPLVVPCHRVVGADGRLTGFGGGVARKRWLLRHEGAALPGLAAGAPRLF